MKNTVLLFLIDRSKNQILFIEKKRGMGKGLWNGPGGKLDPGETTLDALCRESREECGLEPLNPEKMGTITFLFPPKDNGANFDNRCEIFRAFEWSGTLQSDTEECRSFWWPIDKINYDLFWPDDRFWMPRLLAGKTFERIYHFDHQGLITREEVMDP